MFGVIRCSPSTRLWQHRTSTYQVVAGHSFALDSLHHICSVLGSIHIEGEACIAFAAYTGRGTARFQYIFVIELAVLVLDGISMEATRF